MVRFRFLSNQQKVATHHDHHDHYDQRETVGYRLMLSTYDHIIWEQNSTVATKMASEISSSWLRIPLLHQMLGWQVLSGVFLKFYSSSSGFAMNGPFGGEKNKKTSILWGFKKESVCLKIFLVGVAGRTYSKCCGSRSNTSMAVIDPGSISPVACYEFRRVHQPLGWLWRAILDRLKITRLSRLWLPTWCVLDQSLKQKLPKNSPLLTPLGRSFPRKS